MPTLRGDERGTNLSESYRSTVPSTREIMGRRFTPLVLVALLVLPACARAQQPAAAAVSRAPAVGAMAPDFALPGATRYGLLADSVRLSEYRGNTVVLAFFFRARTKG